MQVKVDGKRNITLDFEAPKKFKLLQDGKEIPYLRTGKNSFRLSRNIDGVLDLEEIIEQPKIVKPMQLQTQQMALVNPNDVLMINQAAQQLEVEQNILGETQKRVEQTQAYLDVQQQRINETVLSVQGLETNNAERITATENGMFNLAGSLASTEQNLIDGIGIVNNDLQEHKNAENPHGITKKTIGLDKVDNTSDMDKPISKAVQNALDEKADKDEIRAIRDELGKYQEKNDRFTNALSNYTGGLAGNQLPDGGLTGQILAKKTDMSGDVEWIDSSASIAVDDEFSLTSRNPVENRVITSGVIIKSETLPTASEDLKSSIYQYSGENGTYTHGYIYECQEKTTYDARILIEPNKFVFDDTKGNLIDFFAEITPSYLQIATGIFEYDLAGDIWHISGKDSDGNTLFSNYNLYTEDLEDYGFVFIVPMSEISDGEQISYTLTYYPTTTYEWVRIDVQPNQSAEVASLTTRIGNLETGKQDKLTQVQLDAVNSGANTTNIGQIATNTSDIADINALIPNQATTSNQLADKSFVNSSIATNTAYFIGTFNSVAELEAYSGTLTNNDYAFVATTDSAGNTLYDRYKYNADTQQWIFEYELNNSSFTASQWASINSGATTANIAKISTNETAINSHIANTSNPHSVTKSQVGLGNVDNTSDLSKPISTATQTALNGKQNTISDLATIRSGASAGATAVQPSDLATVATSGLYSDLSGTPVIPTATSDLTNDSGFITSSALTGYATKNYVDTGLSGKQATLVSGTNIKTINGNSVLGSGDLEIKSGSSRNVGEIIESALPLTDAGLHLLDGSLILGGGIYDEFVQYIAGLYTEDPTANYWTTEAAWQQSVTAYGVCGKFVYDSVNNTVRLPKISSDERYLIKSYSSGTNWYRVYSDGWCEQGGKIYVPSGNATLVFLKAFSDTNYTMVAGSSGNTNVVNVNMSNARTTTQTLVDMTGSNSGDAFWYACGYTDISDYSKQVLYEYIAIANSVKTEIEVDIDEIATDLNGKADVDLSNVTASGKETATGWSFPSATYDNLTLAASGTEYTAPASGYYTLYKVSSAANQFIQMINIDNTSNKTPVTNMVIRAHANGDYVGCTMPCKKGNKVIINYTLGGATQYFRFCYADGEI